jgi:hypothetical protein
MKVQLNILHTLIMVFMLAQTFRYSCKRNRHLRHMSKEYVTFIALKDEVQLNSNLKLVCT